jgi:hypothetical protein
MPLFDCKSPECLECQRAFGPDRDAAIAAGIASGKFKAWPAKIESAKPRTRRNPMTDREKFLYCIGQTEAGIAAMSPRAQAYYAAQWARWV